MFEVEFYEDEKGSSPTHEFVRKLENRKLQAKVVGSLEVLAEKGNSLREPYSKHLEDGIFELRCKAGRDIARLLYFFDEGKVIVLTNGFVKKTQKTPAREIRLAKTRRTDYLKRKAR